MLVVAQLAFSVVLLTGTGLAYRSLSLIDRPDDLGFDKENLLLISLNTSESVAGREANIVLLERLRNALRAIPGVTAASHARTAPRQFRALEAVWNVDLSKTLRTEIHFVGSDHLRVLGVAPVAGRDFADDENHRNRTAVISESVAQSLWNGRIALGQSIRS
jgi:hypothetical protein